MCENMQNETPLSKINSIRELVEFLQERHGYGLFDPKYTNQELKPYHPDRHIRETEPDEVVSLLKNNFLSIVTFRKRGSRRSYVEINWYHDTQSKDLIEIRFIGTARKGQVVYKGDSLRNAKYCFGWDVEDVSLGPDTALTHNRSGLEGHGRAYY